jgi:ATP-dependent protease ClpP protease subunit
MRDIPGLSKSILDRASLQAKADQSFRVWGRQSPANRKRTPILDRTPTGNVRNGVVTLRLYEPIDSWGGEWGVSALEFLDVLDQIPEGTSEIRLHINSPGGEVWEALAILNSLRDRDERLVAIVDGIAASAASFIAAAADETIMAKNAQMMIHDASGIAMGNSADMHDFADLLDKVSENIANVYAGRGTGTAEEFRTAMRAETWFNDAEAVAAGLADSVAGDDGADPQPTDAFDLSGIGAKYAGRGRTRADARRQHPDPRARACAEPGAARARPDGSLEVPRSRSRAAGRAYANLVPTDPAPGTVPRRRP